MHCDYRSALETSINDNCFRATFSFGITKLTAENRKKSNMREWKIIYEKHFRKHFKEVTEAIHMTAVVYSYPLFDRLLPHWQILPRMVMPCGNEYKYTGTGRNFIQQIF